MADSSRSIQCWLRATCFVQTAVEQHERAAVLMRELNGVDAQEARDKVAERLQIRSLTLHRDEHLVPPDLLQLRLSLGGETAFVVKRVFIERRLPFWSRFGGLRRPFARSRPWRTGRLGQRID